MKQCSNCAKEISDKFMYCYTCNLNFKNMGDMVVNCEKCKRKVIKPNKKCIYHLNENNLKNTLINKQFHFVDDDDE